MSDKDFNKALTNMFSAFSSINDAENDAIFQSIKETEFAKDAKALLVKGELESCDVLYLGRLERISEAIAGQVTGNQFAQDIIVNYGFYDNHFSELFTMMEGMSCSADKSRSVLNALYKHFAHDKPIAFNYDGEYTYHLPKRVLKDQDSVITCYHALRMLRGGRVKHYLDMLKDITQNDMEAHDNGK